MSNSCFCKLAEEASKLLNDSYNCDPQYNFTRWSKDELIHYAKDAISMIVSLHPKKFTNCVEIELQEGSVQKLPENCTLLTKVIGSPNSIAAPSSIAVNTDDRLANLFNDSCSQAVISVNDYEIESYSIEETSDNIFYVKPPVPKTLEPFKINVLCVEYPDTSDSDYCPETWMHNAIIEFMQYRAYSSEDESVTSASNANLHLEHFYSIIRNHVTAENRLSAQGGLDSNATS